eukprot:jgi/Mesvir1/10433/Mv12064-RA.1
MRAVGMHGMDATGQRYALPCYSHAPPPVTATLLRWALVVEKKMGDKDRGGRDMGCAVSVAAGEDRRMDTVRCGGIYPSPPSQAADTLEGQDEVEGRGCQGRTEKYASQGY